MLHVSQVRLQGFRSFADAVIELQPTITTLLGENSSGKSSVVDALRLLTGPMDGRRSAWIEPDDLHRAPGQQGLSLTMHLQGSSVEMAPYSDAVSVESFGATVEARYTLNYRPPTGGDSRGITTWSAGSGAVADDPDPGARSRLRHVYLPPLRDATRELGTSAGPRIRAIMERLLVPAMADGVPADQGPGARSPIDIFMGEMGSHLERVEANDTLRGVADLINRPLERLTTGASTHTASIGYQRKDLGSLVSGMRIKIADAGIEPRDLAESGMGYANLAYISSILSHLEKAAQADLTLLLVEEPEAHLHPQLQAVLLDYLCDTAKATFTNAEPRGNWLGRVQVVVTTHAPMFAAHSKITDLVIVQRRPYQPAQPQQESAPAATLRPMAFTGAAIPVRSLPVEGKFLSRVERYLDATRSSLLFGPRTMLVEGVAEALLLPPMARQALPNRDDLVRFLGSTVVAIDGVDFEPYLRLLLTPHPGTGLRIGQRVAVLTDSDPGKRNDPVGALRRLIDELGASDQASVFASTSTLEPELYEAGNPAFWSAWKAKRPKGWVKVKERVDAAGTPDERARVLISSMKTSRLRKGDFAQDLIALTVDMDSQLAVPPYIAQAVKWLVKA